MLLFVVACSTAAMGRKNLMGNTFHQFFSPNIQIRSRLFGRWDISQIPAKAHIKMLTSARMTNKCTPQPAQQDASCICHPSYLQQTRLMPFCAGTGGQCNGPPSEVTRNSFCAVTQRSPNLPVFMSCCKVKEDSSEKTERA